MSDTFEGVWRAARNLFPALPPLVVRDFVQDAYTRICETWGWGFLRGDGLLATLASRSVAVTVTQGSATVTSAGLFVASDAGRTFRGPGTTAGIASTFPAYTIVAVVDVNTITLDKAFGAVSAAGTAQILDLYLTVPADFSRFLVVVDPYNQRPIPFWINEDQITRADPARVQSDSGPRYLVAATPSPVVATLGQIRFEAWPAPTAARQYPYLYVKRAARLADEAVLPGLLANRGDLLKLGAQVQAAEWPGTIDQKNPYFNLGLADRLRLRFDAQVQQLTLADDNQYPQQLAQVQWERLLPGLSPTSRWLRQTDATLDDYL